MQPIVSNMQPSSTVAMQNALQSTTTMITIMTTKVAMMSPYSKKLSLPATPDDQLV